MLKQNKRRMKRIKNLVVVCSLTAIILSVSTYAWFIGMRTVNVSSFDVEIASTDSLLLSLDGDHWDTTVSISEATLDDVSYTNHTNWWAGRGLIPMSSIGDMDTNASRMKLFEKASLTTTPGGYRLMASRVDNYTADAGQPSGFTKEKDGYVAFDLFIRNFTGTQYIKALNPLDEEAIYLTTDSEVSVAADGVQNTGIENSVRVAFGQIGRVAGTEMNVSKITGITCTSNVDVTGICRVAQIWEPNDTAHEANAISWYNTSCTARIGEDVTDKASYTGVCGTVSNNNTYPTYAIRDSIASSDNIDIYDGKEYNKYEDTVGIYTYGLDYTPYAGTKKLVSYPYFTDTMKDKTGTERPTFMTLAPSSITKVRIYIYIEGQDIDNYDFASIGKKIAVKFGFTKERYTKDDIQYNGPDFTPPVIKLLGRSPMTINVGDTYEEPFATAVDNKDGDVSNKIVVTGTVNTEVAGTYYVTYNVTDAAGNVASKVVRTVFVVEE